MRGIDIDIESHYQIIMLCINYCRTEASNALKTHIAVEQFSFSNRFVR